MKPKKLSWTPFTPDDRESPTALNSSVGEYHYTIRLNESGLLAKPFSLNVMKGQVYLEHTTHATVDEAKQAAQAHFDETVLTLIVELTQPEPKEATPA